MNTIDPINSQIEKEPQASFSNKEAQQKAEALYPAPSRDTRFLEDAVNEQTQVLLKIKKQITWIIILLVIPFVFWFAFYAFLPDSFNLLLKPVFNKLNHSSIQNR